MRRAMVVLLAVGLACGGACSGSGDPERSTTTVSLGDIRSKLDWVLASGATADDSALAGRFDPGYLDRVPPDALRSLLSNLADIRVTEVTASSARRIVAVLTNAIGVSYTARLSLASEAPHRIRELSVEQAGLPERPASWTEVDQRLAALADRASLLAAEVDDDGTLDVAHEREAGAIAPIGSVLKLYVLGALVEAVERGEVGWDDEVTVEPGDVGIGGRLVVGDTLPIREVARRMIGESDNVATDVVMRLVGRTAVEAMLEPMGMGAASRAKTLPFLTTREMFTVKWGPIADAYAGADEAGRRRLLAGLDDPVPDPFSIDLAVPRDVERVEWFANTREVAAAHLWLDAERRRAGGDVVDDVLGSGNPGLVLDPEVWRSGAFKGGSEPGVLALSWLLERADGRRVVVVLVSWSPTRAIVDAEAASIGYGVVDLLSGRAGARAAR